MLYLSRDQIREMLERLGQPQGSVFLNSFFNGYRQHLDSRDVSALYDDEYFRRVSSHAAEQVIAGEYVVNEYTRFALDYLSPRLRPDLRVLDFGCGNGDFALALAASADICVVGVDAAKAPLSEAQSRVRNGLDVSFELVPDDLTTLGEFDFVVMNDVTEHLSDRELRPLLLSIRAILRRGGEVVIHTPNGLALCNGTDSTVLSRAYVAYLRWRHGWRGFERTAEQIYYDQVHINIKSYRELSAMLSAAGFRSRVLYDSRSHNPLLSWLSPNMLVIGHPST